MKKSKNYKTILKKSALTLALLSISLSAPNYVVNADSMSDIQAQVEEANTKLSKVNTAHLDIESKISSLKKEQEQNEKDIKSMSDKSTELEDLINQRAVAVQLSSNDKNQYFKAIFNADSFSQMISNISSVKTIMNDTNDLLTEYDSNKKQLEQTKKSLDKNEKELQSSLKKSAIEKEKVDKEVQDLSAKLEQLQAEQEADRKRKELEEMSKKKESESNSSSNEQSSETNNETYQAPSPVSKPANVGDRVFGPGQERLAFDQITADYGISGWEKDSWASIVERESGWQVQATNPSSGAYGLPQSLPASKLASAGSDWQLNPYTQLKWMYQYMNDRYGSVSGALNFWNANHWY